MSGSKKKKHKKQLRESNDFVDQKIREGVLIAEGNVIRLNPEVFEEWKKWVEEEKQRKQG